MRHQTLQTMSKFLFCLRYSTHNLEIKKCFLKFYRATKATTGEALHNIVKLAIEELGLSTDKYLVGQGYDGSSNMSGCHVGVARRIQDSVPRAFYVHCRSHKLSLALKDACQITDARNCIGTVNKLYTFITGSPKRHQLFQDHQLTSNPISLKRFVETH